MRYLILVSILSLFISCSKQQALPHHPIVALGSGGMGITGLYPMNSYESILQCLYLGAGGTEIDVQMTKDSVLVAYHDEDLATSTNMDGIINSYTWDELEEASYDAALYTGYSLVRLDTLFSKLDNPEQYIFSFDCKLFAVPGSYDSFVKAYAAQVIRLLDSFNMSGNVLIESPSRSFLEYFKSLKDGYNFYINNPSFEAAVATAEELGLTGIIMDADNISAAEIEAAHEKGLHVQVWGTDSKSQNIAAINKGPDYIQANDVKSLVALLR